MHSPAHLPPPGPYHQLVRSDTRATPRPQLCVAALPTAKTADVWPVLFALQFPQTSGAPSSVSEMTPLASFTEKTDLHHPKSGPPLPGLPPPRHSYTEVLLLLPPTYLGLFAVGAPASSFPL